ncbi:undecaprenyldiphospho-muramoylpentapeptide beta-N-acetylglucosaminyltransferase [Bifidobacterium xylocopae]|uniref:UDP-N-acetylglucosamine--N-acetylmuramyl-(pentapeptide) pyrophosphoryl-undecaprenol N-acetylglucosamine transferase n=1 Tax=Bifidobacterium xylocopae TaxID=2493119 RepID=A0A366KBR1_9BIFI|nr:undecaprenyldiphospho-muramoylpentapeptide beta-N-acetylglucosaminyltransferase [Bifidobacterium xylocopae]RBP99160.1 undecaprenyldiphospho-muramoylpentapeptide beta-N-acetylglucosaminyltransferase [Bifidobacterium xylocopae]
MSVKAAVHVVLAGGGTAGHVNPLLAVAAAIKAQRPCARVSVIGTAVGLEDRLVPQAGLALDTIDKLPFPRRPNAQALRFPSRWRRQVAHTKEILQARQADVVVGFGGYASAPAYRAARRLGLPLALHEQNARAGMANKLGARWADYIGTAYENTGLKPRHGARVERVGLPLRPAIADLCAQQVRSRDRTRRQAAEQLGLDPDRPVLVVTGGSLGAASLNKAVARSAEVLLDVAQVVHLTGKGKSDDVQEVVTRLVGQEAVNDLDQAHAGQGDYHIAAYLERIDLAFACADLVICRSGAGTVSELTALGLPAVYVPLPIGNGEQRFNAQPVVQTGGGIMIADSELTEEWVSAQVPALIADRDRLAAMGRASWSYGIRDAAQTMASRVLELSDARD